MEYNVSVIVPIYNGEKYLERCLESILAQTLTGLEIILVDDGSKDTSGTICDYYAAKQENIKVIHKQNAGLTAAWKTGVTMATGQFVGFVDCDDYIDADMFEILFDKAMNTGADIVCCGLRHEYEKKNHKPWKEQMLASKDYYTKEEMKQELFPGFINNGSFMGRGLQPNRYTKLVKHSLILINMNLCDDNITIGEDVQFSLAMFLAADKIAISQHYYPYVYWMHESSMTGGYDQDYIEKILLLKVQLNNICNHFGIYDFSKQILNDFVCLTVLQVKGEVYKNKNIPYRQHKLNLKEICENCFVIEALKTHNLSRLTLAEELFLFFMKQKWYFAIYLVVRLYFR